MKSKKYHVIQKQTAYNNLVEVLEIKPPKMEYKSILYCLFVGNIALFEELIERVLK